MNALKKEMDHYSALFSEKQVYSSIYFGGGTPSLLAANSIYEIINHLYKTFSFSNDIEITLETNPGTVNLDKLKGIKSTGVNRLSIGVQSFGENDLKFLTRIHDKATAIQTVYQAVEVGFQNINIDLIFNLPGQTKNKWLLNLQEAVSLPIKHISTYSLILEKGTILNKMVLDGKVKISDDDYDADLYEETISFLTSKNFLQYEVSNFAKVGYECRHNMSYWQYHNYLGFGPSAHSFYNGKRWWNYTSLKFYINSIESAGHGACGNEILNKRQMQDEFLMLALRSKGLNLKEFEKQFGKAFIKKNKNKLDELIKNKFAVLQNNIFSLTEKGYAVCDEIIASLI